MELQGKKFMLIGEAGFVGSHIAEQLVNEDPAEVVVYDNFVRGTRANLAHFSNHPRVVEASMTDQDTLRREMEGVDGVFLLAALWLGECEDDPRAALDVNVGQGNRMYFSNLGGIVE